MFELPRWTVCSGAGHDWFPVSRPSQGCAPEHGTLIEASAPSSKAPAKDRFWSHLAHSILIPARLAALRPALKNISQSSLLAHLQPIHRRNGKSSICPFSQTVTIRTGIILRPNFDLEQVGSMHFG